MAKTIIKTKIKSLIKPIYNFFFNIREKITEILDGLGDNVDVSMGRMTPEEVVKTALSVAREKEWIGISGQTEVSPDEPRLFHYPRAEKLIWSIYFAHYFTEEERQTNFPGYKFMLMAHIRIDDGTGEVIFAEPIRPVFYEDFM